jgi:hypothetical protein
MKAESGSGVLNVLTDSSPISDASQMHALSLLRHVNKASPVRPIALSLLDPDGRPPPGISPLMNSLHDPLPWKCDERELAVWCLGYIRVTPNESRSIVESLAEILNDPDPFRKWRTLSEWVSLIGLTSVGLAALVSSIYGLLPSSVMARFALASLLVFVGAILIPSKLLARTIDAEHGPYHRIRAAAATALGFRRDRHAISALAAALFDPKKLVRKSAALAYPDIAECVAAGPDEAPDERAALLLCRALGHSEERVLLATLGALDRIGDGDCVGPVAKLAKESSSDAVRARAELLLPILEERRRNERAHGRLLRPAFSPAFSPESLLHPLPPPSRSADSLVRPAVLSLTPDSGESVEDKRLLE